MKSGRGMLAFALSCGLFLSCKPDPDSAQGLAARATDLLRQNSVSQAEAIADRALAIAPNDPQVRRVKGRILAVRAHAELLTGSSDEAVKLARRSLEYDPDNELVPNTLWIFFWARGRYAESLPYARRVVTLNHQNHTAYVNLATNLLKLGDMKEAIPVAEQALKLAVTHEEKLQTRYLLGALHSNLDHIAQAREHWQEFVRLKEQQKETWDRMTTASPDWIENARNVQTVLARWTLEKR